MELYSIIIILLAVVIGVSPLADKLKIPYPVLLLAAGIVAGLLIPDFHRLALNPEIVFLIFLPPLLYDAAYNISFREFKLHFSTIFLLGISLVFLTASGIAVVAHYCIPDMSWSLAFVLGAILAPPDAVAATSTTKGLGLPGRTITVLEGESLINDASALVAFRFATAAVAGSAFVPLTAISFFIMALIGGVVVGLVISILLVWIVRKKWVNNNVIVALNLMLPFVAYLVAENLHVSGVIAAVTIGLHIASHKKYFPEHVVQQSKSTLDTITFILTGVVFTLIGLEFPDILKHIPTGRILPLIGCSFLIFLVALVIRMGIIFWHRQNTRNRYNSIKMRIDSMDDEIKAAIQQRYALLSLRRKRKNKPPLTSLNERLEESEKLLFTWKEAIVIGWSGMRGIVSVAAAMSLPMIMADGSNFPQRDTILFLTVSVVIIMLVIQGIGLPFLVKLLKMK
ncbi:MAG: cation:proton antiporter [Bacteroidales bacterium]|jgi:CPA1 family monovalent cation:H+ antiporter|nr:cation:proton antiporter [Bacteroidales bacterium]